MQRVLRHWRWILSPLLLLAAIVIWNRPVVFRREWDPIALWPMFAAISLVGAAIGLPLKAGTTGAIAAPVALIAGTVVVGAVAAYFEKPDPYTAAVLSGATAIPAATQMERLYPDCDHFITHFGKWIEGPKVWNSEAFFAGRYVVTMQVDVEIDDDTHHVKQVGQPHFYLMEIESVTPLAEGLYETKIGRSLEFDTAKWNQLVESNGDLWPLGFPILGDEIPLFWDFAKAVRRDRVRINLLPPGGGQ